MTAEELVPMYMESISDAIQRSMPVLELNPQALQIAKALDVERQEQGMRSYLHGIPILLKDNMGTADRCIRAAGRLL